MKRVFKDPKWSQNVTMAVAVAVGIITVACLVVYLKCLVLKGQAENPDVIVFGIKQTGPWTNPLFMALLQIGSALGFALTCALVVCWRLIVRVNKDEEIERQREIRRMNWRYVYADEDEMTRNNFGRGRRRLRE